MQAIERTAPASAQRSRTIKTAAIATAVTALALAIAEALAQTGDSRSENDTVNWTAGERRPKIGQLR
jgi:hypothetical protein